MSPDDDQRDDLTPEEQAEQDRHIAEQGTEAGFTDAEVEAARERSEPDCIEGPEGCGGKVEFHLNPDRDDLKAFARCEVHQAARLERAERHISEGWNSDVPPPWFDPTYAGERWTDE